MGEAEGKVSEEYVILVPKAIAMRIKTCLTAATAAQLLPPSTTAREFIQNTLLANGLLLVEADLKQRERKTALIFSPEDSLKQMRNLGTSPWPRR